MSENCSVEYLHQIYEFFEEDPGKNSIFSNRRGYYTSKTVVTI